MISCSSPMIAEGLRMTVRITGIDAVKFVEYLTVGDFGTLNTGQTKYSLICNEVGNTSNED